MPKTWKDKISQGMKASWRRRKGKTLPDNIEKLIELRDNVNAELTRRLKTLGLV